MQKLENGTQRDPRESGWGHSSVHSCRGMYFRLKSLYVINEAIGKDRTSQRRELE